MHNSELQTLFKEASLFPNNPEVKKLPEHTFIEKAKVGPGIYLGSRRVGDPRSPINTKKLRHQFLMLIPENPELFKDKMTDLGNGNRGIVMGGYMGKGGLFSRRRLTHSRNEPDDLKGILEYFTQHSGQEVKKPFWSPVLTQTNTQGRPTDEVIQQMIQAGENYESNSKDRPIWYPSFAQNIQDKGINSNSFVQSLADVVNLNRRMRDFPKGDLGNNLRVPFDMFNKKAPVEKVAAFYDQKFKDEDKYWSVPDIHRAATSKVSAAEVSIAELEHNLKPTKHEKGDQIPGHPDFVARANKADMKYPILVVKYPDGKWIADGVHRLWRARAEGKKNIMAFVIDRTDLPENYTQKKAKVELDLEIGDVVLTGRYKNKRTIVKSLGTDELGQPTVNGMKLLALRLEKEMPADKQSRKTQSEKTAAEDQATVPKKLLRKADKDSYLRGYVHPKDKAIERVPIFSDEGKVVGFFTPREDSGAARTGAIWVHPEHRGKGYARKAIAAYTEGKPARAFIEESNEASRKAFTAAGFKQDDDREERWGGGHWFRKGEAPPMEKLTEKGPLHKEAYQDGYMSKLAGEGYNVGTPADEDLLAKTWHGIRKNEGWRPNRYDLKGVPHVGTGINLNAGKPDLQRLFGAERYQQLLQGKPITRNEDYRFARDYMTRSQATLSKNYPGWDKFPGGMKEVLMDVYFNSPAIATGPKLRQAIANKQWHRAAGELSLGNKAGVKPGNSEGLPGLVTRRNRDGMRLGRSVGIEPVIPTGKPTDMPRLYEQYMSKLKQGK